MKKLSLLFLCLLCVLFVFTGCPKEPKLPNLDGIWIGSSETDFEGLLQTPRSIDVMKFVIEGNTFTCYKADAEAMASLTILWLLTGSIEPFPDTRWSETPATGTLVISGNQITFTANGRDVVAILANDRQSFSITEDSSTLICTKR